MRIGTVDVNKLRGLADKGAGLAKELIGTVVGNDRMQREGEAQQERATEELKALRKEMEAQQKDVKARAMEARQRAAQQAKDRA